MMMSDDCPGAKKSICSLDDKGAPHQEQQNTRINIDVVLKNGHFFFIDLGVSVNHSLDIV